MKQTRGLPKKTGLRSTKPLKTSQTLQKEAVGVRRAARTSLKAKKPKKQLKLEEKSAQQLIPVADREFSRYVRLRDSTLEDGAFIGKCITCPKRKLICSADGRWAKGMENGHFISRGVHQLRYDEENCNAQCSHCNAWRDKEDMQEAYRNALALKYGDNVPKDLKKRSKAENASKRLTKPELLQIIADSRAQVEFYLKEMIDAQEN